MSEDQVDATKLKFEVEDGFSRKGRAAEKKNMF
jgi:hypothetical protein